MPKKLTRIEFRFKREMLRRYGITSFDDLEQSDAALLAVTCQDWFRLLDREKVRGSENEIADAPIWARVKAAFNHYFGKTEGTTRTAEGLREFRPISEVGAVERVVKQAIGRLSSAAAVMMEKSLYGANWLISTQYFFIQRKNQENYLAFIYRILPSENVQ